MWKLVLRAWLLAALPGMGWAAGPPATATIVDGAADLLRDATRLGLAEGVRLRAEDIVQTGAATRFVRLELADGTVVDLGPATRLMLSARLGRTTVPLYLLEGHAKLTLPASPPAGTVLASPGFALADVAKGVVVSASPTHAAGFAESGALTVVPRTAGRDDSSQPLRSGHFWQRAGDAPAQVSARPTPAFIQAVPRPFLDTLPRRIDLFKSREAAPRPLGAPTWPMLQPWVDAEAALRPRFVTRWRPLAKDPEIRAALVAGIAAHPEWDRTLFPEKYRPKPRPGPAPATAP